MVYTLPSKQCSHCGVFFANTHWLDRFKQRHNIKFKKCAAYVLNGRNLSDLIKDYESKKRRYWVILQVFARSNILPQKWKMSWGQTQWGKSDPIICWNIYFVWKSVKSKCSFPVRYRLNKKVWRTTTIFNGWRQILKDSIAAYIHRQLYGTNWVFTTQHPTQRYCY